jgi:hypothetical protein
MKRKALASLIILLLFILSVAASAIMLALR